MVILPIYPTVDINLVHYTCRNITIADLLAYNMRHHSLNKSTVDKLVKKTKISLVIGTSSWREQFSDAISVSAG